MRRFVIFFAFYTIILTVNAQVITTKNKKAKKLYDQGEILRERRDFIGALDKYNEAIQIDSSFAEAYRQAAAAWYGMVKPENALPYYIQLTIRYPDEQRYSSAHLRVAEAAFREGEYKIALRHSEKYLTLKTKPDQYTQKAEAIIANSQFALERIGNPLDFNPRELKYPINQYDQQYFPVLSADQKTLFFIKRDNSEEIYTSSRLEDGSWDNPVPIDSAITSEYNEGTCSVSADGRTLVFTSCMRNDGFGSCDLYITYKNGDNWSTPKNLGRPINSSAWDSQPALSADGKTLYYVSNRKGGFGKRDIWVTQKSLAGEWSYPMNLGKNINSTEDDISPFLHVNGKTMYFSTDSRLGFGGFDIYYSELSEEGSWQQPLNLGYPINTHEDELAMFITSDGSMGYYSHEEELNGGISSKLFKIDIPSDIKVKFRSSFISGIIYDSLTSEPLTAKIELHNLSSKVSESYVVSDSINGKYLMVLTEGAEYALYVNAKNYLFKSYHFNFSIDNLDLEGISADIGLKRIEKGDKTTLNNVLFELDSYKLSEKSAAALVFIKSYLNNNPDIMAEISGHTDDQGNNEYNLNLSMMRAKTVYNFLVEVGIDPRRLFFKGYGSTEPVATNQTVEGRALNRRIELRILE